MKQYFMVVILYLLLSFYATDCMANFQETYIVESYGSIDEKTIFDVGETPYLYIKLHPGRIKETIVNSDWLDPDSINYFATSGINNESERWISLENWDSIRKEGLWRVSAEYISGNNKIGTGFASFNVTPEPYGIVLFLIGSFIIGLKLNHQYSYLNPIFSKISPI